MPVLLTATGAKRGTRCLVARPVSFAEYELGDTLDGHAFHRRRIARDFWLRVTIPSMLLAGLLVLSSPPCHLMRFHPHC